MACQTFLNGNVSVSWIPLAQREANAARTSATAVAPAHSAADNRTEP